MNGTKTNFIGFPFLKNNVTYIPVRDLANAFAIELTYNTNDKTVSLYTDNKIIIISPQQSFEKIGTVIISRDSDKDIYLIGQGYLSKNNRSYVPLRFIMESLDYNVKYEDVNKTITIFGTVNKKITEASFYTEEQALIIDALRNFENENKISLVGSVSLANKVKNIQAEITKCSKNSSIVEDIKVIDGDEQYFANTEMFDNNGISYSLSKIKTSGEKENVNLVSWGSNHPYFYLTNTGISGIKKYRKNKIEDLGLDGKIQRFAISNLDSDEIIKLGIDVDERKLVDYTYKSTAKNIYNNFVIQYK